jgi:hypothetical protein
MSVLSRFVELFNDEAGVTAPPAVEAVGVVEVPSDDPEQAARREVERAEIQLADLKARRENLVSTIAGLSAERSRLSRLMAAGDLDAEARFAEVEVSLSSSQARLSGVDELLGEAEAALKAVHAAHNESMKPRLAAERRARIEGLRLAAEAEVERLYASYRECCEATAAIADRLEALAGLDQNAADNIHRRTINYSTDPMLVLTTNGWTLRAPGLYTVAERRIVPLVPPAGR